MSEWEQAIKYFLTYLPQRINHWIVVFDRRYHANIVTHLQSALANSSYLNLEVVDNSAIRKAEEPNRENEEVGAIIFNMHYHELCNTPMFRLPLSHEALFGFICWPQHRVKSCIDVSDSHFCDLFSDPPSEVRNACWKLREQVATCDTLSYSIRKGEADALTIGCKGSQWVVFSGFEFDQYADYVLPTGEIACMPEYVDGNIVLDGWIIGTVPFGLKYGRIRRGELELRFQKGKVVNVNGSNRNLCRDLESVFDLMPGVQVVTEVGIGQSKAVARLATKQRLGYHWHEPHYGLHLGLGAELSDLQDPDERTTGAHLDIVFSSGHLSGYNFGDLLNW
ncbi:MAG: hypothetical protein L0226_13805 [Acidobacteria bacterium]|nr:hypothetical protein [Acidobacteriota bacterium]